MKQYALCRDRVSALFKALPPKQQKQDQVVPMIYDLRAYEKNAMSKAIIKAPMVKTWNEYHHLSYQVLECSTSL